MKLILLLVSVQLVFAGVCPPAEVMGPCKCDQVNKIII